MSLPVGERGTLRHEALFKEDSVSAETLDARREKSRFAVQQFHKMASDLVRLWDEKFDAAR
jgi:hypothetical protein